MSSAQTSSFSSDDDNKLHARKLEPLPSYRPLSPPECPQTDSEDGHQLPRLNLSRSPSPDESLPPRSSSEPDEAVPVDQRDGRRSSSDAEEEDALFEGIVARVRRRHDQEDDDSDGPGRTYILHGQEALDRLLDRLGKHHLLNFFQTAIRWNWNADKGQLDLLPMAEAIHEVFKDGLTFLIKDKLNALAKDCLTTQQIVHKLHSGGHSRVGTARKRWQRYPDGQFKYAGHVDPPFIYEIAHTETEHSLSESVDEYMRFRAEEIGGMLAINITYNRLRLPDFQYTAWYSLYSTSEDGNDLVQKRLVHKQVFYDGEARPGQLVIPFKLFVPLQERGVLAGLEGETSVVIDHTELVQLFERGIEQQRLDDAAKLAPTPPRPIKRKRVILLDENDQELELWTEPKKQKIVSRPTARPRTRSQSTPRGEDSNSRPRTGSQSRLA